VTLHLRRRRRSNNLKTDGTNNRGYGSRTGEFFNSLWPSKPVMDDDLTLLLDLADELGQGNLVGGSETIKAAWEWNQIHKKGSKYRLYSLAELAKALRSTNDRSLLNQMAMHEGCKLCMDECVVSGCKTLVPVDKNRKTESAYCDAHLPTCYKTNSKGMDNLPATAPPPTGVSKPLMNTKQMEAEPACPWLCPSGD
jgi:hypothetical protein